MIQLENIEFSYNENKILSIKELNILSGQKVFLYGPSGSGKTTLLNLVGGLLKPNSGKVIINKTNLMELKPSKVDHFRGEKLGFIFQQFNLIPFLSVEENITLPLMENKVKIDSTQFEKITKKLSIENLLNKKTNELSIGQQQRVAAARALIHSPRLLIADEPTSSLDEANKHEFIELLFDIADEHTTILFVSHDQSLARHFDTKISLQEINQV